MFLTNSGCIFTFFMIIQACVTGKSGTTYKQNPQEISLNDIYRPQYVSNHKKSNKIKRKPNCLKAYNSIVRPLKTLAFHLEKNKTDKIDRKLKALIQIEKSQCENQPHLSKSQRQLAKNFDQHSRKIGIVLPLSDPDYQHSRSILKGLVTVLNSGSDKSSRPYVIKDSGGGRKQTLSGLADLLLNHKVGMIIGGVNELDAKLLTSWAAKLAVPLFLLNKDDKYVDESRFVFQVFPRAKLLGQTLAYASLKNSYSNVAILRPHSGKSDRQIDGFKEFMKNRGGNIIHEISYRENEYESMDQAIRKLFELDDETRKGELVQLQRLALQEAKARGSQELKTPILPPRISFDAVFIPDHFRAVRHFVRIFRFHGASKIPLLGNHEWRSKDLVFPKEPFLNGSMFVDFVGDYQNTPTKLEIKPLKTSSLLVDPEQVVDYDYRLIGYFVGKLAKDVVMTHTGKRRQLASLLEVSPSAFLKYQPVSAFSQDRKSHWPAYIFKVDSNQIILDQKIDSIESY